jgi:hypothetical protein
LISVGKKSAHSIVHQGGDLDRDVFAKESVLEKEHRVFTNGTCTVEAFGP